MTFEEVNAVASKKIASTTTFILKCFAYSCIGKGSRFSFTAGGSAKLLGKATDMKHRGDVDEDAESPVSVPGPAAEADFMFCEIYQQEEVVMCDNEDDQEEDSDEDSDHTPASDVFYAPVKDARSTMIMGVQVIKQSKFGNIVGPSDAQHVARARTCDKKDVGMDMLAAAVRLVIHSIDLNDGTICDGHKKMSSTT